MTPSGALGELLARVGTGVEAFIAEHELKQWPSDIVSALKAQKLIKIATPASCVVCTGCEENCSMPVETIPASSGEPTFFVTCDKRSDTNRVTISPDHLTQWQASTVTVAKFIAESLSLKYRGTPSSQGDVLEINIMRGKTKMQMLCLRSGKELMLVAGESSLPLVEAIDIIDDQLVLDKKVIGQLVDTSTTSDIRYTPCNARRESRKLETKAMHESWKKEFRARKKNHLGMSDTWYAIQISRMDIAKGRSAETIRKNMKK